METGGQIALLLCVILIATAYISDRVEKAKEAKFLDYISNKLNTENHVISMPEYGYELEAYFTGFKPFSSKDIEFLCKLAKVSEHSKSYIIRDHTYDVPVWVCEEGLHNHKAYRIEAICRYYPDKK